MVQSNSALTIIADRRLNSAAIIAVNSVAFKHQDVAFRLARVYLKFDATKRKNWFDWVNWVF